MDEKENKRIMEFLTRNNNTPETITNKQMSNLMKVDAEIQKRLSATEAATVAIKANAINISAIAKATGISNKTFYNNGLLKKYVESYILKDEEKSVSEYEYEKLKSENDELKTQIHQLIIRDINLEVKQHEIDDLIREIEELKKHNRNLHEALERKQTEERCPAPDNVVQMYPKSKISTVSQKEKSMPINGNPDVETARNWHVLTDAGFSKENSQLVLVSWNVNGLRACLKNGFLDVFQKIDADIFCLQEIRLQSDQINLALPGYYQYWNYGLKKGYSGTAIFSKKEAISVRYGIGIDEYDNEGRIITLEYEDFYLVNCYAPSSQAGLERLPYRLRWEDEFRQHVQLLDAQKPVVICGDFNVAHTEKDVNFPLLNQQTAGFSVEERGKFSLLLESGFTDTFRYFNPEIDDICSWWSYQDNARLYNMGWRLDYFLTSKRLDKYLCDAKIYTDILGSDHCPIGLVINNSGNFEGFSKTYRC